MINSAKSKKLIILFLSCIFTVIALTLCASAAEKLTSTVGLLRPTENITGEGYKWMNRYDTLYLNGLYVDTEDDYGFKLVDGAKVVLQGKNYIKASVAALYLGGNVTFTGDGSLTLIGGETGILTMNTDSQKVLRIDSGSFEITAGKYGINSYYSEVSIAGGTVKITVSDTADGYAIKAPDVVLSAGASITANNTVRGGDSLRISNVTLDITSEKEAFSCDTYLTIENLGIKAGDSVDSLASVDKYEGQKCVSAVSPFVRKTESIIFGEGYSIAIDIVMLVIIIIALTAAIVVPIVIKKRRTLKKMAAFEAEMAAMPKTAKKKRYVNK